MEKPYRIFNFLTIWGRRLVKTEDRREAVFPEELRFLAWETGNPIVLLRGGEESNEFPSISLGFDEFEAMAGPTEQNRL